MTTTNEHDTRPVNGPADVLPLYEGHGRAASRIGAEVELAFFDPAHPALAAMTPAQNDAVRRAAAARGLDASVEASSETLEIATKAVPFARLSGAVADGAAKIRVLTAAAAGAGLKRSWFEYLPQSSYAALRAQVLPRPRSTAFITAFERHGHDAIAAYFCGSKATHVSVSYESHDALLRDVRRLYLLAPFLFALTGNGCAFAGGTPDPRPHHHGMAWRASLGPRGGVPDYIFTARTGTELVAAHIEKVLSTPLFTWLDRDGNYVQPPPGKLRSFRELARDGLNTFANFALAESMQWPDVKIAQLRAADGTVTGHRYEARMFGVGAHQHATALLVVGALAFDPDAARETDRLLRAFGFDLEGNPGGTRQRLRSAYAAACRHGDRGLAVAYGHGTMATFARSFAGIIADSHAGTDCAPLLAPLRHICATGRTDTAVNRAAFRTRDAVFDWQRHGDFTALADPARCAGLILPPGFVRGAPGPAP